VRFKYQHDQLITIARQPTLDRGHFVAGLLRDCSAQTNSAFLGHGVHTELLHQFLPLLEGIREHVQ
jgi:hypothetical protein